MANKFFLVSEFLKSKFRQPFTLGAKKLDQTGVRPDTTQPFDKKGCPKGGSARASASAYLAYKLDKKTKLAHDIYALNLIPEKGKVFDFRPGQFVMVGLYDKYGNIKDKRAFSLCSSPLNKDYIQLGVKVYGDFSQLLTGLNIGDRVGISGPHGFFTFDEKTMKQVVFFAGGIGLAPFISAIRYVCDKGLDNRLTVFYSNKTYKSIAFYKELKTIVKNNKNISVIFTLTEKIPVFWKGEKNRITPDMVKKYCAPYDSKYFFLCGPKKFMTDMIDYLKKSGVSDKYIKKERWG